MFKLQKDYRGANIPKTVRFTPDLLKQLNDISLKNGISFNYLVLQCCAYAIENMEPEEKEEKTE